jgi:uncharacterized protein YegP (UPF0339 family)
MSELTIRIKRENGQFHWIIEAGNEKKIAWSGEGYKRKDKCLHGLDLLVNGVRTADVIDETGDKPEPLGRANRVFPKAHDGT